jgi:hypothetical protein
MQSVDTRELENFIDKLDKLPGKIKEWRRELHERLAEILKRELDRNIDASLSDGEAKIKAWQTEYVGSGGGYAAVRATAKGSDGYPSSGPNSPGAVTNYLENGHRIRKPGYKADGAGKRKREYEERFKVSRVPGRGFYKNTKVGLEQRLQTEADRLAEEIAKEMSG